MSGNRRELSPDTGMPIRIGPWEVAGLSDTGKVRKRNEDFFGVSSEAGAALVADGMGGHAGGDIASALTVKAALDELRTSRNEAPEHRIAGLMPRRSRRWIEAPMRIRNWARWEQL